MVGSTSCSNLGWPAPAWPRSSGIRAVINGQEPGAQYLLATVFALMLHNLAESGFVRPSICWGLLVIATVGLAKLAKAREMPRPPRFVWGYQPRHVWVKKGLQ